MRVKKAEAPPEMTRLSVSVTMDTAQLLQIYKKAYADSYGEEPTDDYLVNAMLSDYMESDKDFKTFLNQNPELVEKVTPPVKAKRGRRPGVRSAGPEKGHGEKEPATGTGSL